MVAPVVTEHVVSTICCTGMNQEQVHRIPGSSSSSPGAPRTGSTLTAVTSHRLRSAYYEYARYARSAPSSCSLLKQMQESLLPPLHYSNRYELISASCTMEFERKQIRGSLDRLSGPIHSLLI